MKMPWGLVGSQTDFEKGQTISRIYDYDNENARLMKWQRLVVVPASRASKCETTKNKIDESTFLIY